MTSKFNQAEFAATLERVAQGKDFGETPATPDFDPRAYREHAEEAIQGRKIEDYKIALENAGFRFVPAHRLEPYDDGRLHEVGEWRNNSLRMAWTEKDILAMFPGGPREFSEWLEHKRVQALARRAGIILPR